MCILMARIARIIKDVRWCQGQKEFLLPDSDIGVPVLIGNYNSFQFGSLFWSEIVAELGLDFDETDLINLLYETNFLWNYTDLKSIFYSTKFYLEISSGYRVEILLIKNSVSVLHQYLVGKTPLCKTVILMDFCLFSALSLSLSYLQCWLAAAWVLPIS